jgi:diadenosine tetraphosphate (Ap4A) HIT family hydrolase
LPATADDEAGLPPGFHLDARLAGDTWLLFRRDGCTVLLHRNAAVPWFIVVPHTTCRELYQLPVSQRGALDRLADGISAFLDQTYGCDKINLAAIGNVVPQLHLHVIGRRHDDPCWPDPVWGRLEPGREYTEAEVAELAASLMDWLDTPL